jgi:hypothetical protein
MPSREIAALASEIHRKQINAPVGSKLDFLMLNLVIHEITTRL